MKKLLVLGLASLVSVGACAGNASAWFFGCCCKKCCTTVCITPYNAFTPVCCGSICANGCMPINMTGGCCAPQCGPSCFNGACYGNGYDANGNYACLPAPGSFATAQQTPTTQIPGQQSPAQLQLPVGPVQTAPQLPMAPQAAPGPQFMPPNPQLINPSLYMVPMPMQMQPMQPMQPMYGYGAVQPISYYPGYQPTYNPYYAPQIPVNYYGPLQAPAYWYGR